jgi:hypothetical protein
MSSLATSTPCLKTSRMKTSSNGGMNINKSSLFYIKWLSIITLYQVSNLYSLMYLINMQVPPSMSSMSSVKAAKFYPMFATVFCLNPHVQSSVLVIGSGMAS